MRGFSRGNLRVRARTHSRLHTTPYTLERHHSQGGRDGDDFLLARVHACAHRASMQEKSSRSVCFPLQSTHAHARPKAQSIEAEERAVQRKKRPCNASYQHDVRQKVQRARHSPKSLRTEFRPRMTTLAPRAGVPKRSCVEHFVLPNPQTFVSRCTYHCDS